MEALGRCAIRSRNSRGVDTRTEREEKKQESRRETCTFRLAVCTGVVFFDVNL